jgi:hypothetical protein
MDKLALQIKLTWVLGLMINCPLGKTLNNCSEKNIRKLPIEKRIARIKKMGEDELRGITMHCKDCMKGYEIE